MLPRENFIATITKLSENPYLEKCTKDNFERIINENNSNETISVEEIINELKLTKLPTDEDGYFNEFVNTINLSEKRESRTEIFYLINKKQVSCLHKLDVTETWQWLGGNEITIFTFSKNEAKEIKLNETNPTFTIEKNILFGAKNSDPNSFGWVICKCVPGFTVESYKNPTSEELGTLRKNFSQYNTIIDELTPASLKKTLEAPVNTSTTFRKIEPKENIVTNVRTICNI